jgi:hypothetical protein
VFQNYPIGDTSYGYRMYDEYAKEYNNSMSKEDMELPPEEFLRKIKEWFGEVENEMFDYALERGWIEIDGEDYNLELNDKEWSLKKS